jgi:hypothetical protein
MRSCHTFYGAGTSLALVLIAIMLFCPAVSADEDNSHTVMHLTHDQIDEMQTRIDTAPSYTAPRAVLLAAQESSSSGYPDSVSLLSYLPYVPAQRNQGSCGNCWVWASTGALEVDHTVKYGTLGRLSVQYFDSKYNSGTGSSFACCGGWLDTFVSWYNSDTTPIPWTNTNASYGDASTACSAYKTAVPIKYIATTPSYKITTI